MAKQTEEILYSIILQEAVPTLMEEFAASSGTTTQRPLMTEECEDILDEEGEVVGEKCRQVHVLDEDGNKVYETVDYVRGAVGLIGNSQVSLDSKTYNYIELKTPAGTNIRQVLHSAETGNEYGTNYVYTEVAGVDVPDFENPPSIADGELKNPVQPARYMEDLFGYVVQSSEVVPTVEEIATYFNNGNAWKVGDTGVY